MLLGVFIGQPTKITRLGTHTMWPLSLPFSPPLWFRSFLSVAASRIHKTSSLAMTWSILEFVACISVLRF